MRRLEEALEELSLEYQKLLKKNEEMGKAYDASLQARQEEEKIAKGKIQHAEVWMMRIWMTSEYIHNDLTYHTHTSIDAIGGDVGLPGYRGSESYSSTTKVGR